jgi:hypothetical protein
MKPKTNPEGTPKTLGRVELPLIGAQVGEGLGEVGDELIFVGGLDNHIIDICFDVLPNLRCQAFLNCLLVCGTSVFPAKGHDLVRACVVRGPVDGRFLV